MNKALIISSTLSKNPLDFETAKFILLEIIETAKNDLETYAKKEKSSEFYIKKRKSEINTLILVFNYLEQWKFFQKWELLEIEIAKLEHQDYLVSGYNILLSIRKGNGYYSFINIYFFISMDLIEISKERNDFPILPRRKNILEATLSSDDLTKKYQDYKPQFIIEPWIFKNGNNIIGAERGTGKTRLMLFIGFSIVYGVSDCLGYPINHYGNILFLNFEISEAEFKLMVEPIENYFKNELKLLRKFRFDIISFKSHPLLETKEIEFTIRDKQSEIIFIDGFKAIAGKFCAEKNIKEFDTSNISFLYDLLDGWKRKYSTTSILSNHTNKGIKGSKSHSDLLYGPSALADFADQTALIRKTNEPNVKLLIPDKNRFNEEGVSDLNLFIIESDHSSNPTWLKFVLLENGVNEADYMYKEAHSHRHPKEDIEWAVKLRKDGKTLEQIAESILGNKSKKGTIGKWLKKFPE